MSIKGDLKRKNGGLPYHITGMEELVQKMYILLSARKGRFIYDRSLGSGMREVDLSAPDAAERLEACARKALESIPEAEVTGIELNDGRVTVMISVSGEDVETEVRGDDDIDIQL